VKSGSARQSKGIAGASPVLMFFSFAALLMGIKLWLIGSFGNATPYWDQWGAEADFLYRPFLEGTLKWTDLLLPHNEHRILTTRLLVLFLLRVNGIWNPLLQMVVNAAIHIAGLLFFIALLGRVLGRIHLPALLVFSLSLFGVPYGWENTLAGFQSQFYFVLFFSVACLWLTTMQPPLSSRWWWGLICAVLAFFSLASGIFALAAPAAVGLLLYASGHSRSNKQLIAVAILVSLFVTGVMLTPALPGHAALKAGSLRQFFNALISILSWPLPESPIAVMVRNSPILIFSGYMLWKRPQANDSRWFLAALVVWVLGQAASIAYGRATGNLSSRYLDLFAVAVLVNFACLISIARDHIGKRHGWTISGVGVWTIAVLISLGLHAVKHLPVDLAAKRDTGLAQEINVRNYLSTGDPAHLKGKPFLHVPYPDSERLASILASPAVRGILPVNIRQPLVHTSVESQPADAFVPDGYYPTTPKRTGMTVGSYSARGDAATGHASIRYDTNTWSGLLAIPVAGYPLGSGIKIEIEQNGCCTPVIIKRDPKESWGVAYAKVGRGAFAIHLTDSSAATWLAIGDPYVTGRLDPLTNDMLANYPVLLLLGLAAGVLLLTVYSLTSGRVHGDCG